MLNGRAHLTRERELIERLWSDAWRVWFPQGKSDPAICLIQIEPLEGEYWDSSGARGLKHAFQAARAYATGQQPPPLPPRTARCACDPCGSTRAGALIPSPGAGTA